MCFDLSDRSLRPLGAAGRLLTTPVPGNHAPLRGAQDLLWLHDHDGWEWVDASTLAVVARGAPAAPFGGTLERFREQQRATTPLRLPDGRRWWFLGDRLEVEAADGVTTLPWDPRDHASSAIGYGIRAVARATGHRHETVFDLTRGRSFPCAGTRFGDTWVLADRWLVAERGKTKRTGWVFLDPVTRERRPAGLDAALDVHAMLDDGRLLCSKPGTLAAWNHGTSELQPFAAPAGVALQGAPGNEHGVRLSDPFGAWPFVSADGRRVFHLWGLYSTAGLTTLARGSARFTPLLPAGTPLGFQGDRHLVVLTETPPGRLLRCDVETGACETLLDCSTLEGNR